MTQQAAEAPARAWMNYAEAAYYCRLNRVTLWRAVQRGALRPGGVGRAVRFHRNDLDEFMRSGDVSGK